LAAVKTTTPKQMEGSDRQFSSDNENRFLRDKNIENGFSDDKT